MVNQEYTLIILSGGKSSRMGQNKSLLQLGGKKMIEWIIDITADHSTPCLLVTNTPEDYQQLPVKFVTDEFHDKGPLGGIHAGLLHTNTDWNILLPCDTPFVDSEMIQLLLAQDKKHDFVCFQDEDGIHPLIARIHRRILPVIVEAIQNDRLAIRSIFKDISFKGIHVNEYSSARKIRLGLKNINTPKEYTEASEMFFEIHT